MLFEVAGLLVSFAAVEALVGPVAVHHVQVVLQRQTGILGLDQTWGGGGGAGKE